MWLSRILLLYIYEAVTPFGVYYLLIKLLAHREQLTTLHIINKARNIYALWNEWRISEEGHIIAYRLFQVLEWQEVDMARIGMKFLFHLCVQIFVAKSEHTTVSMVDDNNRGGAQ